MFLGCMSEKWRLFWGPRLWDSPSQSCNTVALLPSASTGWLPRTTRSSSGPEQGGGTERDISQTSRKHTPPKTHLPACQAASDWKERRVVALPGAPTRDSGVRAVTRCNTLFGALLFMVSPSFPAPPLFSRLDAGACCRSRLQYVWSSRSLARSRRLCQRLELPAPPQQPACLAVHSDWTLHLLAHTPLAALCLAHLWQVWDPG